MRESLKLGLIVCLSRYADIHARVLSTVFERLEPNDFCL